MHPDVIRELADQHGRELRARARAAGAARLARRFRKEPHRRAAAAAKAEFVLPRISDYVDGTFRDPELAGPGARPDDERPGRRQAAGRRAA
jgi:hypothetical protein